MQSRRAQSPESRATKRWSVSSFDRFEVTFTDAAGRDHQHPILDITTFGARIGIRGPNALSQGDTLNGLKVLYNGSEVGYYGAAKVTHVRCIDNVTQCGLMFMPLPLPRTQNIASRLNERSSSRITLESRCAPHAWCYHPIHFDARVHFQVIDVSVGGARLLCTQGGELILRGAQLKPLHLLLPTIGEVPIAAEVVAVDRTGKTDALTVSVKFDAANKAAIRRLLRFLLVFDSQGHMVLKELKDKGHAVKAIKGHVSFSTVSTPEDYMGVLALRREAYMRAGKLESDATVESMADAYDENSVIICAKIGTQFVGSMRITYCRKPDDRLELDESGVVPQDVPRDGLVEASRLCVAGLFEGTDLVLGLIERAVEVTIKMKASRVITSSVKELIPFYNRLGFKARGKTFELTTMNNIPHHLLLLDVQSVTRVGRGLSPLQWKLTYGSVVSHLAAFKFMDMSAMSAWHRLHLRVNAELFRLKTGKTLHMPRD